MCWDTYKRVDSSSLKRVIYYRRTGCTEQLIKYWPNPVAFYEYRYIFFHLADEYAWFKKWFRAHVQWILSQSLYEKHWWDCWLLNIQRVVSCKMKKIITPGILKSANEVTRVLRWGITDAPPPPRPITTTGEHCQRHLIGYIVTSGLCTFGKPLMKGLRGVASERWKNTLSVAECKSKSVAFFLNMAASIFPSHLSISFKQTLDSKKKNHFTWMFNFI